MATPYDYNLIANFNVNIRVSQDRVYRDADGNELLRTPLIDYGQAILSHSDVEDMLEDANSVANNVTVYRKVNSSTPDLTPEQLRDTRHVITEAVATLIDNLTNVEFVSKYVENLQRSSPTSAAVNRYKHKLIEGDLETTVTLMYTPDILSAELIYPNRPGAIVNNYELREY